ncbi:hypothetical protein KOW79_000732 [Hemibagrus wyckioides]|uniref:Uncharacterized protein n=1 Tax=Hemibagrus wyckioides TaxID=337641 RepID=A0A9D3P8N9_9TELE|nr:hypothetical protein KOW79_000732 [Hemibagrus wyckioides]
MKYLIVLLGLMVSLTLGILGVIHSRRTLEIQLNKTNYFENVKNKVTNDVLKESKNNIADANTRLELVQKSIQELTNKVKTAQEAADGAKTELNTCNNDLNQIKTQIGSLEADRKKSETEFQEKTASMTEQKNNLKTELEKRSKVCDYINKRSVEGMKLCGIVPVIQVETNPEAPKAA